MASRIEDYGLIGNLRTAALISKDGSLDWFCAPRFDSGACFAALLGYDEHGSWSIMPTAHVRERRQTYKSDTLILETEVICDGGSVRLTEFMPVTERADIIRVVEGVEGEVNMQMLLRAAFDYGANKPFVMKTPDGFRVVSGPDALLLRGPVKMESTHVGVEAAFTVKKGERIEFCLSWFPSYHSDPPALDIRSEADKCGQFWQEWVGRCTYAGDYRDAVVRSLITLKALTYMPTGAIVAAPTMGLPEEIGGVRNWDYRFCWLRDSTLTLHALMLGGYIEEATAFRDWIIRAIAGDPRQTQIMYNIDGGRRLTEFELPWLPGYEGSKPVRAGNAAFDQFQLDVFGETISAVYHARKLGLKPRPEAAEAARTLVEYVCDVWQRPDDGVWEVRGGRKHFTYSKIMAWTAVDRVVRMIEEGQNGSAPGKERLPWLRSVRHRIHEEVCQRGFHPTLNAFTQYYGSDTLDASVLLLPHTGFLPATDPRVAGTVAAIEKGLLHDGFVLRYSTAHGVDGLPGTEGAFLACSFWLVDNYAFAGRLDDAERLMEKLLGLCTPLGLLAEEYEPSRQRLIGNFPQGFSHLALIASADILSKARALAKRSGKGKAAGPQPLLNAAEISQR